MMRVEGMGGLPDLPEQNRLKKKKTDEAASAKKDGASSSSSSAAKSQFNQAFMASARMHVTQSLDSLMEDLADQADRLQRSQTFEEMEKYKIIVKAFLHKLSHEYYHLEEAGPKSTRKGQAVSVIIQRVDERVDALAKQLLGRQAQIINLMSSLDEIRGLLMDLYK